MRIVKENREKFSTGVVHSFTGDEEELTALLDMNLYIGVNGCSLKTKENIEIVKKIQIDKMMLESDCPYCDIRKSHAGSHLIKTKFLKTKKEKYNPEKMVKDRNEPCTMIQVLEVVAAILEIPEETLSQQVWENTHKMFNISLEDK